MNRLEPQIRRLRGFSLMAAELQPQLPPPQRQKKKKANPLGQHTRASSQLNYLAYTPAKACSIHQQMVEGWGAIPPFNIIQ